MSSPNNAPEVLGRALFSVIPVVLMLWGAAETVGPVRWALLGWCALMVTLWAINSASSINGGR